MRPLTIKFTFLFCLCGAGLVDAQDRDTKRTSKTACEFRSSKSGRMIGWPASNPAGVASESPSRARPTP